jgi:hypothetical protein
MLKAECGWVVATAFSRHREKAVMLGLRETLSHFSALPMWLVLL